MLYMSISFRTNKDYAFQVWLTLHQAIELFLQVLQLVANREERFHNLLTLFNTIAGLW